VNVCLHKVECVSRDRLGEFQGMQYMIVGACITWNCPTVVFTRHTVSAQMSHVLHDASDQLSTAQELMYKYVTSAQHAHSLIGCRELRTPPVGVLYPATRQAYRLPASNVYNDTHEPYLRSKSPLQTKCNSWLRLRLESRACGGLS
jgi:hypothetical protein